MTTRIVAIDGGGGAGKSTLAKKLAAELDGAIIVHADDFIPGGEAAPDWWQRLHKQVLVPLSKNEPARYQRFDWGANKLAEWHDVEPGGTVILEGVTSLRKEFQPYLSYGIWIDTPHEVRLERGVERDGEHMRDKWHQWMSWDEQYFNEERPDRVADIVVDGTKA